MSAIYEELKRKALKGEGISRTEALALAALPLEQIPSLCDAANTIRAERLGNSVYPCAIVNARSGLCSEDCRFCAQSIHHKSPIETYPLIEPDAILRAAKEAEKNGARHFSIVTSGRGAGLKKNKDEFLKIIKAIKLLYQETNLKIDASLGILTKEEASLLSEAGVYYYHHNIETSRRFYSQVATTHTFDDRLKTIQIARDAGMKICAGGIIGMGETMEDRIDMALQLRDLKVDSFPINILIPIPGSPLQEEPPLPKHIILQTLAIFRFILPDTPLRMAAGRERALGDAVSEAFLAGVNGIMIGDFLTTPGQDPVKDMKMLADLGFDVCNAS